MRYQSIQEENPMTAPQGNMELLSEKLARHLAPEAWQALFNGQGRATIKFVRKPLTLMYAQPVALSACSPRLRESFVAKVKFLTGRHFGRLDLYSRKAAVVFFEDAKDAVQMAMELQRCAVGFPLRIGVHTDSADLASFEVAGRSRATLLGGETAAAAEVAATAAVGSIAISPTTYKLVQDDLQGQTKDCLVMEEFLNSDLASATLTPAPMMGGNAQSTFAGLGLTA
jgi:class 3 adenylate cyclase